MEKKLIKTFVRKMKKSQAIIGRERDRMRDLLNDYQGELETIETAHDDMERVLDDLSQYL